VPVSFDRDTGAYSGAVLRYSAVAQSKDVSADGVYLMTRDGGQIVFGELLRVSIAIPEELRRQFPFSRIVGLCRIVRVDQASAEEGGAQRFAVAFCEDRMTMLSAIVFS